MTKYWVPDEIKNKLKFLSFDAVNKFPHWPSWTGNIHDIFLIHFVDGSAYSLYGRDTDDPSINPAYQAESGGISMLDVFYLDRDYGPHVIGGGDCSGSV